MNLGGVTGSVRKIDKEAFQRSGSAVRLPFRLLTGSAALFFLLAGVPVPAFDNPAPPPELGDTLTSYRTRQQLLDEAVRQSGDDDTPQVTRRRPKRVYKQDENGNIVMVEEGAPELSGERRTVSDNSQAPAKPVIRPKTQVRKEFSYEPNHQFALYRNAIIVFNLEDSSGYPWDIARAEVSNQFLRAIPSADRKTVVVSAATSQKMAMGKVKLFLTGVPAPLEFVISTREDEKADEYYWKVSVPYPAPENPNRSSGYTNMKISARARNSFDRDGSDSARAAAAVSDAPQESGDGAGIFGITVVSDRSVSPESIRETADLLREVLTEHARK